jgi:hypothetical protein
MGTPPPDPKDATADASSEGSTSLRTTVGRGMSWMLLATVVSKVATSLAQVLLGWWLLPEHFGKFAMATTIAGLLMLAKDGGIPNFLNKKGHDGYEELKGPSFWMCLAYNLGAAAFMSALAWPLAMHYGDRALALMLWVMAISLPLGTPAAILQAKLRLDLRFRDLSLLLAMSMILRQILTVIFAKMHWMEMSFVLPVLVTSVFDSCAAASMCVDRPWKRAADAAKWMSIFLDTRWLINGTVASFTIDWGPYVVLGKLISQSMLGVYFFAYQITAQIGTLLAFNLQMVLLPVLSKLSSDRERQGAAFMRVMRALTLFGSFLCMGVASVMEPLEHLIWRGRWQGAVPVVIVFGIFYPWRVGFAATCAAMIAQGRYKFYSMTAWFEGLTLILAAWIGATLEPSAASVAWWTGGCVMITRFLVTAEVFRYSGMPLRQVPGVVLPGWLLADGAGVAGLWIERKVGVESLIAPHLAFIQSTWLRVSVIDVVRCLVAGGSYVMLFVAMVRVLLASDMEEAISFMPMGMRAPLRRALML